MVLQKGFLSYFLFYLCYNSKHNSAWIRDMEQEAVSIIWIHSCIYSFTQNSKINSEDTGLHFRSLTGF